MHPFFLFSEAFSSLSVALPNRFVLSVEYTNRRDRFRVRGGLRWHMKRNNEKIGLEIFINGSDCSVFCLFAMVSLGSIFFLVLSLLFRVPWNGNYSGIFSACQKFWLKSCSGRKSIRIELDIKQCWKKSVANNSLRWQKRSFIMLRIGVGARILSFHIHN